MTQEVAASAVALARMRVTGIHQVTGDRLETQVLQAAAERAGRRLVDATTPDSRARLLTLGWLDGAEPVAGGDTGVFRAENPGELVLTFAAALRACWLDAADLPFPGRATSVESILEARAILGTISGSDSSQGKSAEHHRKSALKRLQEAGYLAVTGQTVRLGPVVATWSEGQVNVLRTVYGQLPVAPDSYAATAPVGERPEQAAETDEADEAGRLDEDPALDLDGQEEAW